MDQLSALDPCDISVSIVSYNTCDLLRDCLKSLLARERDGEASLEIIVADNGSTDGSLEMVRNEFPEVRIVETGGNIGYGRANNAGLEQARGRYFFVLNSDTEVEPNALRSMRDFMDRSPTIGMLGAQLVLLDGSIQESCANDPNLAAVFWEQTYLDKILPNRWRTGGYTITDWDYGSVRDVNQVCGACFFVRREAFRQIGGFDPAYFMYFEDTDFCVRLRKSGWSISFFPEARIQHHLGASSAKDWRVRARMIASYNQSRYYYFRKNGGAAAAAAIKGLTLLGASLRLIAWSGIAIARPAAREQARMFADVWRQTFAMKTHPRLLSPAVDASLPHT